jgi:hypothetical protein
MRDGAGLLHLGISGINLLANHEGVVGERGWRCPI